MARRLVVLGTGYLGTTHAACMAQLGFDVLGVDTDAALVVELAAGRPPFHEAGLGLLLARGLGSGRLRFTTSYEEAAAFGDVYFLCVGTPALPGSGKTDLSQLRLCIERLAPLLRRPCLIVGKSTVPVGTAAALADEVAQLASCREQAELAWNPEFLREGFAVEDTLRPERIVAGVRSVVAEQILREIYADFLAAGVPFIVTDFPTAELVKLAANAFLATKISFINAMAEVCESAKADVSKLADALSRDRRIGRASLRPGLGFGGGCLPKDLQAFLTWAEESGVGETVSFLHNIEAINLRCRTRMVKLAADLAGGSLRGKTVGILGLAFKPDSDDIRDSPALAVAIAVHSLGARVVAYDPAAMGRARHAHPELEYADSLLSAAADADLLLLLTEWAEFCQADPEVLGRAVNRRAIADGRHALDPQTWAAAGWAYRALGQPYVPVRPMSSQANIA